MMNNYIISIDEKNYKVQLEGYNQIYIDSGFISTEIEKLSNTSYNLKLNNKNFNICVTKISKGQYLFSLNGNYYDVTALTELEENTRKILNGKSSTKQYQIVRAPMPGMILKINKKNGDEVKVGDSLIIFEAMKMENEIKASKNGIVKEVHVKEGSSIEKNDALITFE